MAGRIDRYQQGHPWLGVPIAVVYKFFDDQAGYLAALLTYYGFVSLFPLLLLAVTVLGFLLQGNAHLQHQVLNSALSQFPIVGKQVQTNVHQYKGSGTGLIFGILGSLYGGLGVMQAGQNAFNHIWGIPRNNRPNPIKSRARSLVLLAGLGTGALLSTSLTGLATDSSSYVPALHVSGLFRVGAIVVGVVLNSVVFVAAFRSMTARDVTIREVLPGALTTAVLWQLVQSGGTYYLAHKLHASQEVYGVFGLVLGMLAWIYLLAVVVMLGAEVNAVLHRHLWPRALLTPFTDNVDLTEADQSAYESYAHIQRFKGFEKIDATFDERASEDRPDLMAGPTVE
ncbi:MAG TPA: YihY/virulence factor BrkB family protein [Acidimicrobiales bacterium]|jgi:YihY family inner membrane protein|nr:YihY/virulence factor BrkB family protein [Acidimicrobiales bacterium]